MKKLIALLIIISILCIGCADNKIFDGKEYETYGLFNESGLKDPCVNYELAWGNIVWTVLLFKTAVMPIYFIGFSMWEPVDAKYNCKETEETEGSKDY